MTTTRDVIDALMHRRASANPAYDLFATFDPWEITAAETAAGVTPNYPYPVGWATRYMTSAQLMDYIAGTASVSQISALNNTYNVAMAGTKHGLVYMPGGKYLVPNPGLSWGGAGAGQNDIYVRGEGPNSTVLLYSGNSYTLLKISADTGSGTTGTNLIVEDLGIAANVGATGVNGLFLADYLGAYLRNLQIYSSGDSLTLAGMACGVCDNLTLLTSGTNASGNTALKLTTDTAGIATGPFTFNGGQYNGQSNVTDGGAIWSQKSFSTVFNSPLITAFGPSLNSVAAFTNADDVVINGGYSESGRNTTADTAVLFDLGATAACQNFTLNGGTYFCGASGHFLKYGINSHNTQALRVAGVTFSNFVTSAIKYTLALASLVKIEDTYSTGTGSPPVLDSSIADAPASQYLKSWGDPWPRVNASLGATAAGVTGDGTVVTVLFDTKNFDSLSNYNTGTGIFTVPTQTGGMYDVSTSVMVNGLTAANTGMELDIVQKTSGGSLVSTHAASSNPGVLRNAANQATLQQSCLLKCSGGDQISVTVNVSGNASKNVGIVGTTTEYTRMCVRYLG